MGLDHFQGSRRAQPFPTGVGAAPAAVQRWRSAPAPTGAAPAPAHPAGFPAASDGTKGHLESRAERLLMGWVRKVTVGG